MSADRADTAGVVAGLPEFPTARACPFSEPGGYAELRREGPLTRARLYDGRVVWVVTGYDEGRAVLGDHQVFSSKRADPRFPATAPRFESARKIKNFLGLDPPEHTRQRRMVIARFTHRRVSDLRPEIVSIVDDLVDRLLADGPVADLLPRYALPVPSRVICLLLGVPYADHDHFERQSRLIVDGDSTLEQSGAAFRAIREYLEDLIRLRRRQPLDTLLDALIADYLDEGALPVDELAEIALLLLVAGHETTANAITLGVLTLIARPELRAAPPADLIEELLRVLSIADGPGRFATRDTELAGVPIAEGDGVVLGLAAMNRDASVFPDPGSIDPARASRRHLAFGFGIHQCLGQHLARTELEISLGRLFARIPDLRLAVAEDELRLKHPAGLHGLAALPVTW
ncbi:cytochrome P450 [Actinokineospora auranticolor]|uniref:Pentalenic acid synthase n=1 Tax=Actinokineospora auranticolor TaxID=155976 RepID=A0A2S6GLR2_9PSEU|nr:cytochrome P450 [Actinokineospora auranticolor]PPK66157.1 pentalenic acid synthase [Actinokineospora auranticolor]